MFYCPKCQQTYDEGAQRFCSNDGGRLLPAPSSGKSVNQSGGVFTNLLGRVTPRDKNDEQIAASPKFVRVETAQSSQAKVQPGAVKNTYESAVNFERSPEPEPHTQKPLPRIIKHGEVLPSQARLGDRQTNPTGRLALMWDKPRVLLGQVIKGRYQIVSLRGQDETTITYAAEDKLTPNKKVIVQVLMDEDETDRFTNKIFAEERVSLSLINHPNIARILDSGELLEGKPFIVTEYTDGESVAEMLKKTKQVNALRTAKIVNQVADALNAAHQNGVLHRNLKPENIILTVSETGSEQVKLINFGTSKDKLNRENIVYKSPEQLNGKLANYASDIYSLAVVAYQMLTGRLPFGGASVGDLLDAQHAGLTLHPTNLRMDLPPSVDPVFETGLAFTPSERYAKARDFGDALLTSLKTDAAEAKKEIEDGGFINDKKFEKIVTPMPVPVVTDDSRLPFAEPEFSPADASTSVVSDKVLEKATENKSAGSEKAAWGKRSPEPVRQTNWNFLLIPVLGLLLLLAAVWGLWSYLLNRAPESQAATPPPSESVFPVEDQTAKQPAPITGEIEVPPPPRTVAQPPNTVYYQNSKEKMNGDLAKNFLGFSLYYPKDWKQNDAKGNFIDVSKTAPTGSPIEQFLVSYYNSKGTFTSDTELFPALVKETNATLTKLMKNYEMVSEGRKTVNNGWQAYEVTFKGGGKTAKGEDLLIWGKRLFIPPARPGMKNGYVITMLATSLSPDVKGVEDVGVKGELSAILESFEPNQNF